MSVELQPHPLDPTGLPIVINGHIDQLRWHGYAWVVWDVKNGKGNGVKMLQDYALQQSAYLLALNCDLSRIPTHPDGSPKKRVQPGGVIRTRDYTKRQNAGMPLFHWFGWMSLQNASRALDAVRLRMAELRSGNVSATPCVACGYCNVRPPSECFDVLETSKFR